MFAHTSKFPQDSKSNQASPRFDAPLLTLARHLRERYEQLDAVNREESLRLITLLWPLCSEPARAKTLAVFRGWIEMPASLTSLVMSLAPVPPFDPVPVYSAPIVSQRDEASLLTIARNGTLEELRHLAARPALPVDVMNVILLRSDQQAFLILAMNGAIHLNRAACRVLATLANKDEGIRRALVTRQDLCNAMVEELWPWLDTRGRAALLAAGQIWSLQETRDALKTLLSSEKGVSLFDRSLLSCDSASLVRRAARFLMEGQAAEAAFLMGRACGIEEGLALNLVLGRFDRGAMLLARLSDFKSDTLLALLARRLPKEAERLPYATSLRLYNELSLDESLPLIEALGDLWQKRHVAAPALKAA
jgi:hypothetical protein